MLQLNTILSENDVEPKATIVARHRPHESELRRVITWIAAEQPDLFNIYQAIQWVRLEAAMTRASVLVSFLGHSSKKAVFVGAYSIRGYRKITFDEYWSMPENQELSRLGMTGLAADAPEPLLFDLVELPSLAEWKGKLVIDWPGLERSWWRWADRNVIAVRSISEESILVEDMPPWNDLLLSWNQLAFLPTSWRAAMRQWRGVYFIFDVERERGYVGSACGSENILGRWLDYAASGHGGNVSIRQSNPEDLRFSILELTSPAQDAQEVGRLENLWKKRLHTREHGLNEN